MKDVFYRRGPIFNVSGEYPWSVSHAQVPFGFPLDSKTVRVYFSTRDDQNRSVATFLEYEGDNPKNITYVHNKICLGLGELGTFDDRGAMISCVIEHGGKLYMYFTGWNIGVDVPYRLAIGLAISSDGGLTFERYSKGPIMDRSVYDPGFCCTPYVLKEDDRWRMYYLSGVEWIPSEHPEPRYHVKYAESEDGLNWVRKGEVSLDFDDFDAVGNQTVLYEDGIYKMFYSYRKAEGYRTDPNTAYRLGYAISEDGIHFTPRNDLFEIVGERQDWEMIMSAYPRVYMWKGKKHMLYNGNGFGRSGFGYATSE